MGGVRGVYGWEEWWMDLRGWGGGERWRGEGVRGGWAIMG